jgi:hypothetical protein
MLNKYEVITNTWAHFLSIFAMVYLASSNWWKKRDNRWMIDDR